MGLRALGGEALYPPTPLLPHGPAPWSPRALAKTLAPGLLVRLQVKCDQYWPVRGTETYGLIQVTLLDTVELATYTVRTFALHKVWAHPSASLSMVCRVGERELRVGGWGWGVGSDMRECTVAASTASLCPEPVAGRLCSPHSLSPPFSPERLQ